MKPFILITGSYLLSIARIIQKEPSLKTHKIQSVDKEWKLKKWKPLKV